MTRYFYRDPLAAAWMAKHFGMKIEWSSEDGWQTTHLIHNSIQGRPDTLKLYIHSDSLHLLEAQENDILKNTLGYPVLIRTNGLASLPLAEVPEVFQSNETVIIHRNNIPFMYPECEA